MEDVMSKLAVQLQTYIMIERNEVSVTVTEDISVLLQTFYDQ